MNQTAVPPSPRPSGPHVMHQRWQRLLFLHWSWEPGVVQRTLPPGLTVDTFDGRAWMAVVPFAMRGVRPRFCPAVPGISDFLELNVRTYVRDRRGRRGVWFYSLDCAQPVAVWAARTVFHLPYFQAEMTEEQLGEEIRYACRRRGSAESAVFRYRSVGPTASARVGTLEAFLVERYRLFARRGERLLTGEVWHEPYAIQAAEVSAWDDTPLRQAGFDPSGRAPEHAVFAPGVDVWVYGIERV